MSILIRSKRLVPSEISATLPSIATPFHTPIDTEEPEQARIAREAPEYRISEWAEAPDAGEGRGAHSEQEFTHGRSQS